MGSRQPTGEYLVKRIKFMSFFAGLDTEAYDRQYTDRQLVQRMNQLFPPLQDSFVLIVIPAVDNRPSRGSHADPSSQRVDIMGQELNSRDIALLTVRFYWLVLSPGEQTGGAGV